MMINRIEIVSIPVSDQDRAKAFYRKASDIVSAPWARHVTLSDPDGNGLVLQQRDR